LWVGGIIFELFTQPADMYVDGAAVAVEIIAPHPREDQVTGEDSPLIAHQLNQ